jgi:hypothetical protein
MKRASLACIVDCFQGEAFFFKKNENHNIISMDVYVSKTTARISYSVKKSDDLVYHLLLF